MQEENKPLSRSAQLTPLSKDHHEGLLFVWKIRQGLKNGTDHPTIARFVHWYWQNYLQDHFKEEEQFLAPHLPSGNKMVQRMLDDHQEIEALIHINEQIADESLLEKLATIVHDHIRFEERELFPFAEEFLPENELNEIHSHLAVINPKGNLWKEEFWLTR